MNIKMLIIILLTALTFAGQLPVLADTNPLIQKPQQNRTYFCAESSEDNSNEQPAEEEEEEPDCD